MAIEIRRAPFQRYCEVVETLREFSALLSTQVLQTENITLSLRHGLATQSGQEFRLVARVLTQEYEALLLSCYVPEDPYPLVLDCMGVEDVLTDLTNLKDSLYQDVVGGSSFQASLRAMIALSEIA